MSSKHNIKDLNYQSVGIVINDCFENDRRLGMYNNNIPNSAIGTMSFNPIKQ